MNNDKLSKLINKFYNINDLYKDDISSKIEKPKLMSEIFNDMKQIGINNSYELLDIISTKNYSLLDSYVKNANNLILFIYEKSSNLYKIDLDNKINYIIKKNISIGSYHQIIKIKNPDQKTNYALRKQKDVSKNDLFDSFSDFFIHSILSLYQKIIYKQEVFIPNLYYIGINEKLNKAIGVMTLYNGSLLDILSNKKINEIIKIKIIFTCLYQITFHLNNLQQVFKFTHNDLKVNNIFYKSSKNLENLSDIDENIKINFYIGDFGFSRLKIFHPEKKKNIKIYGGALLAYSNNSKLYSFIPGKDLYFLCHNIYIYSPNTVKTEIINFFKLFNDFDLYLTFGDNWFKIYGDFENHKLFEPKIFMNILKKSYYSKYILSILK